MQCYRRHALVVMTDGECIRIERRRRIGGCRLFDEVQVERQAQVAIQKPGDSGAAREIALPATLEILRHLCPAPQL